ncbi:MAG: biotin/lipoyl-containing protein [Candidatus Omnitrophota bacterium]|nr:biotin/lipoyl-containing protein [Candidatus Omnitrophota bacterium]|tara:strand:+ start:1486 stop:1716 length:231 start_codon:yes stop_codon:yes gene_type:complete
MAEFKLPALTEGVNEAVVSFWHFKEGDSVTEGDELVEMATDKAAFNVPCKIKGVLKKIVAEEGATIKVGEVLAVIE